MALKPALLVPPPVTENWIGPSAPRSVALPFHVSYVPYPPLTLPAHASPCARLVNTWITPPIASAPYRLDAGPRRISTRSIWSSGIASSDVAPTEDDPTRK